MYDITKDFNPRSPHGERQRHNSGTSEYDYFNPRSPHGERRVKIFTTKAVRNFNPRSPHGERQRQQMRQINRRRISIHAPRTGSDESPMIQVMVVAHFNPRSPHGERLARRSYKGFSPDISIHAPRTGSDLPFLSDNKCHHLISIHAPRTGSDRGGAHLSAWGEYFNPRSPHGERRASSRFCYSYL